MNSPLTEALNQLVERRLSGLPVVDDDNCILEYYSKARVMVSNKWINEWMNEDEFNSRFVFRRWHRRRRAKLNTYAQRCNQEVSAGLEPTIFRLVGKRHTTGSVGNANQTDLVLSTLNNEYKYVKWNIFLIIITIIIWTGIITKITK